MGKATITVESQSSDAVLHTITVDAANYLAETFGWAEGEPPWRVTAEQDGTLIAVHSHGQVPAHDCGLCDGPLTYDGLSGWHTLWRCAACGWTHTSQDCCDPAVLTSS